MTISQDYTQGLMIGLGVAFIVVPGIFIGLRLWAKRLGCKALGLDDYLAVAAFVFPTRLGQEAVALIANRYLRLLALSAK